MAMEIICCCLVREDLDKYALDKEQPPIERMTTTPLKSPHDESAGGKKVKMLMGAKLQRSYGGYISMM
eukprot:3416665-Ditylum_brightwellii.AAC.2